MTANLVFGSIFLVMGLISWFGFITKNEKMFSKAKKEKINRIYGEKLGPIFHFLRYVGGPIVIGLIMIIKELS